MNRLSISSFFLHVELMPHARFAEVFPRSIRQMHRDVYACIQANEEIYFGNRLACAGDCVDLCMCDACKDLYFGPRIGQ